MDQARAKAPTSFWVISGLSLLWNAMGAYDYSMTRMRNTEYLSQMGNAEEILGWIDSFPIWAQAGWGLGVWASVLGSVLLLLRSRHAVTAFLASLVGAVVSFGYQLTHAVPASLDNATGKIIPLVIVAIILFLWQFSRREAAKGTLG